jgi:hypothetical protein
MRMLIAIAVLVGAAFMVLFALLDLVRELSHSSNHSAPDPESSNGWDDTQDEDAVPSVTAHTGQWPGRQYRSAGQLGEKFAGSSNALDDLRSAL